MGTSLFQPEKRVNKVLKKEFDLYNAFTLNNSRVTLYPGIIDAIENIEHGKDADGVTRVDDIPYGTRVTTVLTNEKQCCTYTVQLTTDKGLCGILYQEPQKVNIPLILDQMDSLSPLFALYIVTEVGTESSEYQYLANMVQSYTLEEICNDPILKDGFLNNWASMSTKLWDRVNSMPAKRKIPISGKIKKLEISSEEVAAVKKAHEENIDYSLHQEYADWLAAFIPVLASWYVVPKWVKDLARMVKISPALRNFYLTGEAGTGKTMGAQALAALLGVPYGKLTCNEDFEVFDIFGGLMPVTDTVKTASSSVLDGITADDLVFAPEMVAQKVGAKSSDFKDIMEAIAKNGGKEYHYVESDAVRAYRYGGVCEIQEAKVVRKAGTLVGMNNMLENGPDKCITLPTGEVVKKHPNCIFVFTSNEAYEGCRTLNQSVLSRMNVQRHIDLPDEETMAARVMKKTGFPDREYMRRMVEVVREIHEYCEKQEITDGVCGMRELESWAEVLQSYIQTGSILTDDLVKEIGEWTVLNKTSQLRENVEEIRTAKWDAKF